MPFSCPLTWETSEMSVPPPSVAALADDDQHRDDDDRQEHRGATELDQALAAILALCLRLRAHPLLTTLLSLPLVAHRSSCPCLGRARESPGRVRPAHVAEGPGRVEGEEDGHQHRAAHAPLADRLDVEQLQVGQVGAEAEADQRQREAGEARGVAAQQRRAQQQYVPGDPDDRDVDPEQVGVGAAGDRLAAPAAGQADRGAAARVGDRDVGGDADADRRHHGRDSLQRLLSGEPHRTNTPRTALSSSGTLQAPSIRVRMTPRRSITNSQGSLGRR